MSCLYLNLKLLLTQKMLRKANIKATPLRLMARKIIANSKLYNFRCIYGDNARVSRILHRVYDVSVIMGYVFLAVRAF